MSEKPTYEELEKRIQKLEQVESEHKRTEKALRQSEERYRGVVEDQTEIISRFYPDHTHTFVNDVYCRFFGKLKEELIGKKWFPNVYPDDVEMIKAKLMTMSPSNPVMIIENRVFSGKGDVHWMQFVNRGFYDHTGNLLEIQAVGRDITELKQAEKELLEGEERYKSFFKNNHSIMLLIDPENADIVDANPAAISYYGWSHEDLTGKKITDINILTKEKVFQEMERAKKEQRQHFYFRHRLSNGEIRDVEVYSSPITIYNKNFLFSIIFDTTDRELAQSALIESERELKIKAKDLEELNAALKVLLNKRQEDKEELEEGILSNVKTLIEPYIVKLKRSKLPQSQKTLLNILESNLNEIVSPFTRKLSSKYLNLTPTQIQVANLVKQGKTNKDISEILHVAGRTIAFHRENIRKKLNLTNKKTNLKTYLMSID